MTYKFAFLENGEIKKIHFQTYQQAEEYVNYRIESWKRINKVKNEGTDKSFIKFKEELMQALQQQKENNDCQKCLPEQHEGHLNAFCRCEDRNIIIAKHHRNNSESPWQENKKR